MSKDDGWVHDDHGFQVCPSCFLSAGYDVKRLRARRLLGDAPRHDALPSQLELLP